jgi:hypothetical protein
MSAIKIGIFALSEKEAKSSMYKLLKEKQDLLQKFEDFEQNEGIFSITETQAIKFCKEKKALQHEINIMQGYTATVNELKRAFVEFCERVDNFGVDKMAELEHTKNELQLSQKKLKDAGKAVVTLSDLIQVL